MNAAVDHNKQDKFNSLLYLQRILNHQRSYTGCETRWVPGSFLASVVTFSFNLFLLENIEQYPTYNSACIMAAPLIFYCMSGRGKKKNSLLYGNQITPQGPVVLSLHF